MSSKPGLRMKELMEATGLPKSTILFYLEQGLLPKPVKTSRNMAYYPPECMERPYNELPRRANARNQKIQT